MLDKRWWERWQLHTGCNEDAAATATAAAAAAAAAAAEQATETDATTVAAAGAEGGASGAGEAGDSVTAEPAETETADDGGTVLRPPPPLPPLRMVVPESQGRPGAEVEAETGRKRQVKGVIQSQVCCAAEQDPALFPCEGHARRGRGSATGCGFAVVIL